jgi:hypothetical protein
MLYILWEAPSSRGQERQPPTTHNAESRSQHLLLLLLLIAPSL